jgi:MFS family permease
MVHPPNRNQPEAGSPSDRPTRRRFVVMAFLCSLSFLTYFDRICIMRASDGIRSDLGISKEDMGLVFGAFWLAYALFELPAGWMGDRYGARITLTRIVAAWSVFTILSGSATTLGALLAFRFLFGMGEAGAYPNMARVQASWLPAKSRARAGGLLWLLARLGAASSPLLFGVMLRFFDAAGWRDFLTGFGLPEGMSSWRPALWTAGLVGMVWCVVFFWWFRDDPATVPSVNSAELQLIRGDTSPSPGHGRMPHEAWLALVKCPSLWAMGLLYLCGSFGWSFFASWIADYLKEMHQISFENSEIMSGLPFVFGGLSCLVGGVLSDAVVRRFGWKWLGRALFPLCGYTVAAVAMFLVPLARTSEEACLLMCLASAGNDFGQGANWATIVDLGGPYAGTAAGFINMIGNAGNAFQPAIGAWIVNAWGWDILMRTYACAFLAAAAMWLFIRPDRPFLKMAHDDTATA